MKAYKNYVNEETMKIDILLCLRDVLHVGIKEEVTLFHPHTKLNRGTI